MPGSRSILNASRKMRLTIRATGRSSRRARSDAGLTLSDYVLEELRAVAQRPPMREWLEEVSRFEPSELSMTPAEALAAERRRAP